MSDSPFSALVRRVGVTLLGVAALVGLDRLPLPGVDLGLMRSFHSFLAMTPVGIGGVGLGSVGVAPWISAAVAVELVAFVVPGLRRLRRGPAGRRVLFGVVVALGTLLAAVQAISKALVMRETVLSGEAVMASPSFGAVILVAVLIWLGSLATGGLCLAISRWGLGVGLGWALALGFLGSWSQLYFLIRLGEARLVSATTAAVTLGLLILWVNRSGMRGDKPLGTALPFNALGVAPYALLMGGLFVPVRMLDPFVLLFPSPALEWLFDLVYPWTPSGLGGQLLAVVLTLAVGVALLRVFHPEARVQRLNPGRSATELKTARMTSGMVAGVFLVMLAWGSSSPSGQSFFPHVGILLVAPSWALDIWDELNLRRRGISEEAWQLQDVHAVIPVIRHLEANGVPAGVRGVQSRSWLHLLGPYLPMGVLVPAGAEERTRELLEAFLVD